VPIFPNAIALGPDTLTQDVRVTASFELAQFEVYLPLVVRR
jgi:hypothetical protein